MNDTTIAIIGAGNIGISLCAGFIANGIPSGSIWLAGPDARKLTVLKNQYHVNISTDNLAVIQHVKVVILAVKVNKLKQVTKEMASTVQQYKPLVISVATGVDVANLEEIVGKGVGIVRAMPNTPSQIRCGVTALFANTHITHEQHALAESLLSAVGMTVWLQDEKLMDVVTALSGSGPAYFFFIAEALQQAGEKLGLSADVAKLLTAQTMLGAARMVVDSNTEVTALRQQVTSPGGTTEQAVKVLEDGKLRDTLFAALQAATLRAKELAKQFADNN